jgi:serine/threonine protein kinase/Tfp pilus assembly protein PilF
MRLADARRFVMPERSERAKQIAAAVRALESSGRVTDAAEREKFIQNAVGDDPGLRAEVTATLQQPGGESPHTNAMPALLVPGTLLNGRYRVMSELGRGGFGIVYLAQDQQLHGRPVVVKVQSNPQADDSWFARKFAAEIQALALIDHPGVVGALDTGKTPDGRPFLVMQYVDGSPLRSAMRPEGMPLDRAANILRQIGQALSAAHDKGVWHRDLKPENIMLQPFAGGSEHVRLIDFGIASITDTAATQSWDQSRVAGTLPYMAPEQKDGQVSASADIYAFGVIAYEMITGRKPFVAPNAGQLAELQHASVRIKPCLLRPELSAGAQKLILQALSYNPKERPASAQEFGDRLANELLAGGTVSGGSSRTDRPWGVPHRPAVLAAIICMVAAGAWLLHTFHTNNTRADLPPAAHLPAGESSTPRPQPTEPAPAPVNSANLAQKDGAATATPKPAVPSRTGLLALNAGERASYNSKAVDARNRPPESTAANEAARIAFEQGSRLEKQGKYADSIPALSEAILLQPDNAEAYFLRCDAYHWQAQEERALADCTEAIRLKPDHVWAYTRRCAVYSYMPSPDYARALQDCNEAIRLDPEFNVAYNNRGFAYAGLKQFDRALQDWQESIHFNPDNISAHHNLAHFYFDRQQYDKALREDSECIRIAPNNPEYFKDRGMTYIRLQQYRAAVQDFNEAIRMNPGSGAYYNQRAYAKEMLGDTEAAAADRQHAQELSGIHGPAATPSPLPR